MFVYCYQVLNHQLFHCRASLLRQSWPLEVGWNSETGHWRKDESPRISLANAVFSIFFLYCLLWPFLTHICKDAFLCKNDDALIFFFFFFSWIHLQELLYSCRYISKRTHWYYNVFLMDTGKKHWKKLYFHFCKKKKKDKRREKSVKEIIFWEGIFISCLSKMSCVLSQLFHFILFYFSLTILRILFIETKSSIILYLTCSLSVGSKVKRGCPWCDVVLPHMFWISEWYESLFFLWNFPFDLFVI